MCKMLRRCTYRTYDLIKYYIGFLFLQLIFLHLQCHCLLSITIHIKCSVARCLISVVYLTVCTFIRFWMTSPMTRNQLCKLINRYQVIVFWYQVYQSRLQEHMLNCSASLPMSTRVLVALPGKLDIKRHSPSILYLSIPSLKYMYTYAVHIYT